MAPLRPLLTNLALVLAPLGISASVLYVLAPRLQPRPTALQPALLDALLKPPPTQAIPATPAAVPELQLPEPAQVQPAIEMRVMLQQGQQPVLLKTTGATLQLRNGRIWHQPTGPLQLGCQANQLRTPGSAGPSELWLQARPGLPVSAAGQRYRGRLRLLCQGNQLTVINHLPLEDYIASVVGAEMPSHWPAEALKAQAIAARSYAMAHLARPADPHWNLGDTTRWQAYSGLGSESQPVRAATRATRGLILSLNGGIVESLYASDRALSLEAHGSLGASMSQQGARRLAEQGYRFNQILGTYYPGASLAQLERG